MSTATKLIEIGELRGIEKGIEEGIEKGIEKGRIIENQEILIKFLKSKFGSAVTKDDLELIKNSDDINDLKNALEAILSDNIKDVVLDKLK